MPHLPSGGISLFYESTGDGTPVVFVHEFSGDSRSWEPQVRHFARTYRCVTFNARGYPPSDVPAQASSYSQDLAVADVLAVLDALEIPRAHLVGLSMGGFTALHTGLRHPDRVRSLAIAGVGYGVTREEGWRQDAEHLADFYRDDPVTAANSHGSAPGRVPFMVKDPRGYQEFLAQLRGHDPAGSSNTMRGVQARRPNLLDLEAELGALPVPLLVICGDEDDQCLEASLYLKRACPMAGLAVLPRTGHTLNLEEPGAFSALAGEFIAAVDAGSWRARDPRSAPGRNPLGHR
jgi:pimeloyl-ACP methyl ester carboxylesterase